MSRITPAAQQWAIHRLLRRHGPLLLVLALFSALTLYQSAWLPLGEAADETDHYQYHRFMARSGHPPLTAAERREAGFKGGLAPLYYWLTAWPVALVGEDARPDIRRVDSRPERHIPTDGLGINHVLHTLDEQWPWRGQPLAWHLVRLLSLPMGWVTIIATYALAGRLVPRPKSVALLAAGFVALLPRFVISSAVINDDNLVFALTALLLLAQVILLQQTWPPGPKLMAIFGALFGLALVTKYFSLILVPEVLFTLGLISRRAMTNRPALWRALAAFAAALFLTAGLWFIFIALRFNRIEELGWIAGLAASLGEPQITEGLLGLLSGQSVRPVAATYPLLNWVSLLYRSFWFEFGWMRIFAPVGVYLSFTLFAGLVLLGLIEKTLIYWRANQTTPLQPVGLNRPLLLLLGLHLSLYGLVVLARYVLSATIDTGQGRHLYPALPVIALLVALGLHQLRAMAGSFRLPPTGAAALGYGLPLALFLGPALTALLPGALLPHVPPLPFISTHYRTLPVTTAPLSLPPPEQQLQLEFAPGLSLTGLDAPSIVSAGSTLPVTLYWHAAAEAAQDYLLSLCLHDDSARPAACRQQHFADGHYPARAWEAGDTLIDTVYLPIPTCARLTEQQYYLHLEILALDPTQPEPTPLAPPRLRHRFQTPAITIKPAAPPNNTVQSTGLWQAGQRLTGPVALGLNQSLTQLRSVDSDSAASPRFVPAASSNQAWPPLPNPEPTLHLPCGSSPQPVAHHAQFVANPTLVRDDYRQPGVPPVTLALRDRRFAPVTTTLSFSHTLAPLSLNVQTQTIPVTPTATAAPPRLIHQPGAPLPVTIHWQTRRWMAQPLVIALKLLDKDFAVGGERVATLGDRYPNVLWAPGEIVVETYPLRLNPDAPPGLYRLELGLLRQDTSLPAGYGLLPVVDSEIELGQNLYPLTVRLLDPAHGSPPAQPFVAQVGDAIRLTGFEVNPAVSDSPSEIALALFWQSTAKPPTDYTVFTQLLGPDGQVWGQWDNPPQAGRYPTSAWRAADAVIDRYRLTVRQGAPSGDYRLLVGMYDPATGQRLPATINGQPQPDNALMLQTVPVNSQ